MRCGCRTPLAGLLCWAACSGSAGDSAARLSTTELAGLAFCPPGPRLCNGRASAPACLSLERWRGGARRLACRTSGDTWWGTKDSFAWEKALLTAVASRGGGLEAPSFVCHPCAHLSWTTASPLPPSETPADVALEAPAGIPQVVDFGRVNSAQQSMELAVDWERVRGIALRLEQPQGSAEPVHFFCYARIRSGASSDTDSGAAREQRGFELEVADVASLEVALAYALVDEQVSVRLLPREGPSADPPTPTAGADNETGTGMPARPSDGWSAEESDGKHVMGYLDANRVRNSRDNEPCCWWVYLRRGITLNPAEQPKPHVSCHPHLSLRGRAFNTNRNLNASVRPKVWMFAKRLVTRGDECWTGPQGLGHVPVRWSREHSKWVAGNRHRYAVGRNPRLGSECTRVNGCVLFIG